MSIKATELIFIRNEFYARSFDQIKSIVTLLIFITIALAIFAVVQGRAIRLFPRYIPTTTDGRLIISPDFTINHLLLSEQKVNPTTGVIEGMPAPTKLYSELMPDGENALVLYWARLAVDDMFDYDYIHYRMAIEHARKYFTATGHDNFIQALIDSRNLETVKARSCVVVPQINGPVKLIGTNTYRDRFAWDLEVSVTLTYESVSDPAPLVQNLLAQLSIVRITTLESPFYGLAIYKLNFEQTADTNGSDADTTNTQATPSATTPAQVGT
jgi:hypothetical protein